MMKPTTIIITLVALLMIVTTPYCSAFVMMILPSPHSKLASTCTTTTTTTTTRCSTSRRSRRSILQAVSVSTSSKHTSNNKNNNNNNNATESSSSSSSSLLLDQEFYENDFEQVALATIATLENTSTSSLLPSTTTTTTAVVDNDNDMDIDMERQKQIHLARWLLIGAAALYGTNFSFVKIMGESMPVGISSTLRFGMAALATSPWLIIRNNNNNNNNNNKQNTLQLQSQQHSDQSSLDWNININNNNPLANASPEVLATIAGFEVGMWNSFGYVAQAIGLETTLASKSAFLCSLAVVTVPVIDAMTGKLLKQRELIGAIMALVGVAVLELGGTGAAGGADVSSQFTTFSAGDMASLFQPIAFGMGFWKMEQAMHKYPNQANRSTAAQLMAVFISSFLYTAITDPAELNIHAIQQWLTTPSILASLVYTGVISTALTIYMETVALKTLTAAETTLIFLTEPLWGSMFAAAIMGEQFGMDSVAGGVMILAGCLVSNLGWKGMKKLYHDKIITKKSSL